MHFEILVEDQSGKRMLDILIPKIIGDATYIQGSLIIKESVIFLETLTNSTDAETVFCSTNCLGYSEGMETHLLTTLPIILRR